MFTELNKGMRRLDTVSLRLGYVIVHVNENYNLLFHLRPCFFAPFRNSLLT